MKRVWKTMGMRLVMMRIVVGQECGFGGDLVGTGRESGSYDKEDNGLDVFIAKKYLVDQILFRF